MSMTEERKEKFRMYKEFWDNLDREKMNSSILYVDFKNRILLNNEEAA